MTLNRDVPTTVSIALISMYFPDVSERVKGGEHKRRDWVDDACLELDHLSLPLLVASQLEVLRPLQRHLDAPLALRALHAQHDLLRRLGLKAAIGGKSQQIAHQFIKSTFLMSELTCLDSLETISKKCECARSLYQIYASLSKLQLCVKCTRKTLRPLRIRTPILK